MTTKQTSPDLEQTLKQLEEVVAQLESGKVPLTQGLDLFEKGVALYKECKKGLTEMEKKVKILTDELKEEEMDSL